MNIIKEKMGQHLNVCGKNWQLDSDELKQQVHLYFILALWMKKCYEKHAWPIQDAKESNSISFSSKLVHGVYYHT